MKKEIVYTDKYALILSDEPARDNKYGFQVFKNLLSQVETFDGYDWKEVIAHLPLSDAPILEGVPLLPPLPQGDDVEELASTHCFTYKEFFDTKSEFEHSRIAFKHGYNKAKEKYKFTEEDLAIAIDWYYDHRGKKSFEDLVEHLSQQQQRPTHFEYETTPMDLDEIREQGRGFLNANISKHKTITNSQGQVELVGKYLTK